MARDIEATWSGPSQQRPVWVPLCPSLLLLLCSQEVSTLPAMTELNKGDSVTEAAAKSTEYPEESGHGWGGVSIFIFWKA